MFGMVIVSHSQKLAEGVVELVHMIAKNAVAIPAGGLDDGGLGTSFDKIQKAIATANTGGGVAVLMDMGSAVMTAEMVLESLDAEDVKLIDAPLVEGATLAASYVAMGKTLQDFLTHAQEAYTVHKLQN